MMATATLNRDVTLEVLECINCGVPFAIPKQMHTRHYEHGGFHYCPNGHCQGWDKGNCKTALDKLRSENAQLQSSLRYEKDRVESAKRQATAIKGQMTKLQNRVANGVCPCCKRSFVNLQRHMKTKHPEAVSAGEPNVQ